MILVLGAGVIGVATAYYLAKAGCAVVVIDRQSEAGQETSYANAGQISPGYAAPWAGPGVPLKAIKWLLMRNSPLVIRPRFDLAMWRWIFRFLRSCNTRSFVANKKRMLRLSEYSRLCLQELRRETGITYDERTFGTLHLFRNHQQLESAKTDIRVLRDLDIPFQLLDMHGCIEAEPGLSGARIGFAGGLRLPMDETGDCLMFTRALARTAAMLGVRFVYNTSVRHLIADTDRVVGAVTDAGEFRADACVVATGSYSPMLLRPLGIRLPVYPVKGYSITLPIGPETPAPRSTILDETFKVAITRLGRRVRVGGTAEIAGYDLSLRPRGRRSLERSVGDLFPRIKRDGDIEFWTGLRPMTPDGPPVVSATRWKNLYVNTGHGTLGWTMACGSGRVLADVLIGRRPEIPIDDLVLDNAGL